ncbi:N-acetyl-D-Glu racemase DgcA [Sphingomonas sp. SRS2]|uniref:N-acetyl-D-Glu racemase DgcA n=1 Tax=Sphingomonas sp. SRS2 TaxID=133190 RepID=UPI0006184BDB|nr:N-acetyl-D-Glu racemase DgcA [Sphingomonas sp. SRS2]KKC27287.1 mandelate racemase [Sphingomonas sp. SRS2]
MVLRGRPVLTAQIETWPVAGSFVIARGAKTDVDVVTVTINDGLHSGRGEATAIYYHGESAQTVLAQVQAMAGEVARGIERADLLRRMPRGAARNAIDCALWDLEAKRETRPVWSLAGLSPLKPLQSAFTISLGPPERMEQDALKAAALYPLLKLKLAGEGDVERVAAVRRGAPDARLIVDANESWTGRDVAREAAALLPYGVELIEQPVRAGEDHLLDGVVSPIPLCADESCQDRADLPKCSGRYNAINIKLDKAGGLTEGLALAAAARAAGLEIMVGCMLSTSLGIAPAILVGQGARWVDIDGPLLLGEDRPDPVCFERGVAHPALPALWG